MGGVISDIQDWVDPQEPWKEAMSVPLEFQWMNQLSQQLGNAAMQNMPDALNFGNSPLMQFGNMFGEQAGSGLSSLMPLMAGGGGVGLGALMKGATEGYMPDLTGLGETLAGYLKPSQDILAQQGTDKIYESSNVSGIPVRSTSTGAQVGDFMSQLMGQGQQMIGGSIADIMKAAAPASIEAQAASGMQLSQMPQFLAELWKSAAGMQQQQNQFPLDILSMLLGGGGGAPVITHNQDQGGTDDTLQWIQFFEGLGG